MCLNRTNQEKLSFWKGFQNRVSDVPVCVMFEMIMVENMKEKVLFIMKSIRLLLMWVQFEYIRPEVEYRETFLISIIKFSIPTLIARICFIISGCENVRWVFGQRKRDERWKSLPLPKCNERTQNGLKRHTYTRYTI